MSMEELDLVAYNNRREALEQRFQELGRGSRTNASHDLRVPPTYISEILNGKRVDLDLLTQLEKWAAVRS